MKKCRRCKLKFEPTAHQLKKSDFLCIPCQRESAKQWREKRKIEGRPVIPTKMPREWHREYEKEYFSNPENRARAASNQRRYRNDPELRIRHIARWLIARAIASGKLIRKPCEVCGEQKTQAHHDDYMQPLIVRWLCVFHHNEHHHKAKGE